MSQDESAVNEEVEQTTQAESAPVENQTANVTEDDDLLERIKDLPLDGSQSVETESEATEEKPEASAEETQTETKKSPDEQSPQDEWNNLKGSSQERFQQTINERNELRRQMEELQAKQAQFATEQDLVNEINPETGEYYTPQEIERISWLQSREALNERNAQELYNLQVQHNQAAINDEAMRVTQEIPLLNPQSKEYDPEIGQYYAELLNDNLIYVTQDGQQVNRSTLLQNGIDPDTQATLVGYSMSPYKLAKFAADSVSRVSARAETIGQAKAQKAQEKMLANADVTASAPQRGGNTLDDLFDRVKDIPLS